MIDAKEHQLEIVDALYPVGYIEFQGPQFFGCCTYIKHHHCLLGKETVLRIVA